MWYDNVDSTNTIYLSDITGINIEAADCIRNYLIKATTSGPYSASVYVDDRVYTGEEEEDKTDWLNLLKE